MLHINESDFRRIDLNLLVVFSALMRERNVSRAAQRLFLGQPAVSAALKRLRELFSDELFVRTANGMEPTARALELAERLGPSLAAIRDAVVEPNRFDPTTARQIFKLGMTDALEIALAPNLVQRFRKEAPFAQISIRPTDTQRGPSMLDTEELDLAIGVFPQVAAWQQKQELFQFRFVCLFDGERLGMKAPLTLKQFVAFPHLLTTFSGQLRGYVDEQLEKQGLPRHIVMGTYHFTTLPFVLEQTDTIATMPQYAAYAFARQFGLTVSAAPFPVQSIAISMIWRARSDRDPALGWLRTLLAEGAREASSQWGDLGTKANGKRDSRGAQSSTRATRSRRS